MTHKILYVDDEVHNLDAFSRAFFGVELVSEVLTVQTPEEAVRILATTEVSAIITDQRMPGMTGTELLERVVATHPDPVRLILTAYTEVKDVIDAINRGHVFYFITKPWSLEELRLTVRRALEHYEMAQDLKRKNRELATAYANLEAIHREKVRFYEMVVTDEKTGLRNYHYFRIRLGEEFERARRYGNDLALVMVDIDDFRLVNDQHGHGTGDAALAELAQLLLDRQRAVDVVARYGGEEFALVLPETGILGAKAIAERIRQRVSEHKFAWTTGRPFGLTISCGVAAYPHPELTTKEQLIQRADRALFLAKTTGKNRVSTDV